MIVALQINEGQHLARAFTDRFANSNQPLNGKIGSAILNIAEITHANIADFRKF